MLQLGGILKTLCWVKQARRKRTNTVRLHFSEVPGIVRFIETEARGCGDKAGLESYCFMGFEFQFGKVQTFWRGMVSDGCPTS